VSGTVSGMLCTKKTEIKEARGMLQVVEYLLSKCEALSSNPVPPPPKKKKKKKHPKTQKNSN
jgi:hypothetical protein